MIENLYKQQIEQHEAHANEMRNQRDVLQEQMISSQKQEDNAIRNAHAFRVLQLTQQKIEDLLGGLWTLRNILPENTNPYQLRVYEDTAKSLQDSLMYSCSLFPQSVRTIDEAAEQILHQTIEKADSILSHISMFEYSLQQVPQKIERKSIFVINIFHALMDFLQKTTKDMRIDEGALIEEQVPILDVILWDLTQISAQWQVLCNCYTEWYQSPIRS